MQLKIYLNNVLLDKEENRVYLGITFDSELRFGSLIDKMQAKGRNKSALMKCLVGKGWGPFLHA